MKKFCIVIFSLFVFKSAFAAGYNWPALSKNAHVVAKTDTNVLSFSSNEKEDNEPDDEMWFESKEFGFNVTTLVRNFIPFNLGQSKPGFIALHAKFYGDRNLAFRVNLGGSLLLNLTDVAATSKDEQFVYGSLGYEKRRGVHKNWYYTSGWDAFLSGGIFTEVLNDDIHLVIGASKFFGIEYAVNDKIFIGTEAQAMFGVGTQFFYKIVYPNSIFFNIRFN